MKKVNPFGFVQFFPLCKRFLITIRTRICMPVNSGTGPFKTDRSFEGNDPGLNVCKSEIEAYKPQAASRNMVGKRLNHELTTNICLAVNGGVGPWKPVKPANFNQLEGKAPTSSKPAALTPVQCRSVFGAGPYKPIRPSQARALSTSDLNLSKDNWDKK
ncbi:hypothetical protein [Pseudoalteromonas viridis]|uniref:Uncharacterized protein n=1 Tax=Pseudoalteromonas viridis TaxID=339617 RepID=A0ABX7V958_9GAMM|nr:hypothetical protein [Pseudoalteromonas viridis]QTL37434.1 hypothetical protein J5X90_21550 [Pseudoalteromonas viridis]